MRFKDAIRILLVIPALVLTACTEEVTIVPAKIVLDNADDMGSATVNFGNKVETKTVSFKADGDWFIRVPSNASWLTVTPTSGTAGGEKITVNLTVPDNPEETKQKCHFGVCQ